MIGCNGRFVPDFMLVFHDVVAWRATADRGLYDLETRKQMYYAEQQRQREDTVVQALVRFAERSTDEHRAILPVDLRTADEAARIAAEHGFTAERLAALRSLARSRGVVLEDVLRAALRGELGAVVALPPRPHEGHGERQQHP